MVGLRSFLTQAYVFGNLVLTQRDSLDGTNSEIIEIEMKKPW